MPIIEIVEEANKTPVELKERKIRGAKVSKIDW
jgi:hypothetical protein